MQQAVTASSESPTLTITTTITSMATLFDFTRATKAPGSAASPPGPAIRSPHLDQPSSPAELSTGTIIGIAVGSLFMLILVVALLRFALGCCCAGRARRQRPVQMSVLHHNRGAAVAAAAAVAATAGGSYA
ncbi:hypothetical protein INS49_010585 [Diaporthe citri]|uniref:uncharacterized protein n=1 Tax=Diaporthe citri TaxID=83186 RepID=UPI001C80A87B|nr:uncharacterized protein INS49_010585 [Diaporthe citri]KAG6362355.1 hypothetical protein INS49_010585 [Diaporthe citri]